MTITRAVYFLLFLQFSAAIIIVIPKSINRISLIILAISSIIISYIFFYLLIKWGYKNDYEIQKQPEQALSNNNV